MKLESVRIRNFRSFDDVTIDFGDYTCFVGPNGAGKSNVLHALNVFFREPQDPTLQPGVLREEDFHDRNTAEPVEITLTFTDLSEAAAQALSHYYRQGKLVVSAVADFDPNRGEALVIQRGERLVMDEFRDFFEADKKPGTTVAELRRIYENIREAFPDLEPPGTRDQMRAALRSYEEQHEEMCSLTPSDDQFYGISRGKNLLRPHLQWVYVPAVKEISAEDREGKATFLGMLLDRTVRQEISFDEAIEELRRRAREEYASLLETRQDALDDLEQRIANRLREWAHPDAGLSLEWAEEGENTIRIGDPVARAILHEHDFEGPVSHFGHGLQRAYLLALLQVLAEGEDEKARPTLILACEEPELYQHPPQARHLYELLLRLSEKGDQIIVCTHSPLFVSAEQFENVRVVRRTAGATTVTQATLDRVAELESNARGGQPLQLPKGVLAKLQSVLHPEMNEMFFAPVVILVEGPEDAAYISTYMMLTGRWDDYRRLGCHIVPVHGKDKLTRALAVLRTLDIPVFVVFDADGPATEYSEEEKRRQEETRNLAIMKLCEVPAAQPFPPTTVWHTCCVIWPKNIRQCVMSDIGPEQSRECHQEVRRSFGSGDFQKKPLYIASVLEVAWERGYKSAVLEQLCEAILHFARERAHQP